MWRDRKLLHREEPHRYRVADYVREPQTVRRVLPGTFPLGGSFMFRGGLLWLIGIPIPIIIVLWLLGFL